jgi:predicted RNA-binding Zn ribbon-like protein
MAGNAGRTGRQPVIGPAPGRLELVRAFVNTLDVEAGTDDLSSPEALAAWFAGHGLTGAVAGERGPANPTGGVVGDGGPAKPTGRMAGERQPANSTRGVAGEREPVGRARQADLRRAVALREAIRDVLQSHVGRDRPAAAALAGLRSLAGALPVRLEIDACGAPAPATAGHGATAGLAALLLIAAESATLGTWQRLKVCSADDCRWAFYDRSPTKSGCWCSMAGCGARAKSRAYRQRAAAR